MYLSWGPGPRGPVSRRRVGLGGVELRQAASGERHSLLLLSNGQVHSCGDNGRGQLGQRGAPRSAQLSECGTGLRARAPAGAVLGPGDAAPEALSSGARLRQFRFPGAQFVSVSSAS